MTRNPPTFVLVLALAACGGEGAEYSFVPTKECLSDAEGVAVTTGEDDLSTPAVDAPHGALRADFGENVVEVGFERSEQAAKRLAREGREIEDALAKALGEAATADERISAERNAVIWWDEPPTDEENEALTNCLRA